MAIDDSRRPQPADPEPAPVASDDGVTGNEFGRPPSPGEVTDDGQRGGERELAADVGVPAEAPDA